MNEIAPVEKLTALAAASIETVEKEMLKHEQLDCPVIHRFGPGTYIREVHLPKGALIVGHHQNLEHTNIFLKGSMTLLNDGTVSEITAPMIFVGQPGRKVAQIHEDCVWLNVYPNIENEQDVEKLEAKFLTKSENFKLSEQAKNAVLLGNRRYDNDDYFAAIKELSLDDHQLKFEAKEKLDYGGFKVKTSKSRIHGKGLFATAEIMSGEFIGPVVKDGKMTTLAQNVNHSRYPNAKFSALDSSNFELISTEKIFGCRGGFDGDEITVDYREAFKLILNSFGGLKWLE
jgi:hypothetical protein